MYVTWNKRKEEGKTKEKEATKEKQGQEIHLGIKKGEKTAYYNLYLTVMLLFPKN